MCDNPKGWWLKRTLLIRLHKPLLSLPSMSRLCYFCNGSQVVGGPTVLKWVPWCSVLHSNALKTTSASFILTMFKPGATPLHALTGSQTAGSSSEFLVGCVQEAYICAAARCRLCSKCLQNVNVLYAQSPFSLCSND